MRCDQTVLQHRQSNCFTGRRVLGVCRSNRLETAVPRGSHMASFYGTVLLRLRYMRHLPAHCIHHDKRSTVAYSQSKFNGYALRLFSMDKF